MPTSLPDNWWATAVIYQLYVRSFADDDGDGKGDLAGIRHRLDHIAELGVDAIWLNPCYPSPQRDHGYDVADYFGIEPDYGDLEEFDRLVADAAARGIRIVMDVVPNHCSSEHPWFVAAVEAGRGSAERERFWFRDGRGPDGSEPPNNWQAIFGGSAWTRVLEPDGSPGQWYLGVFTPHQPDFNWNNPEVADHFDEMLGFWFDRGVEGFRADAVTVLGKVDGLPDSDEPPEWGRPDPLFLYHEDGHRAWERWRRTVDDYNLQHPERDVFLIAEAYTPERPDVFATYVSPSEFHQSFYFDLLLSPWQAGAYRDAITAVLDLLLPRGLAPAWTLNNHDAERSVTRFGRADATADRDITQGNLVYRDGHVDVGLGQHRATAAAMMILALPGSVYLYMGEELGLPEVLDLPDDVREDPVFLSTDGERRGRDGCRVPLPWTVSAEGSHGFSPAGSDDPWLPQPDGWGQFSAEADGPVHQAYRRALEVRRASPDVRSGVFRWVEAGGDTVAFERGGLVVVLNMGEESMTLEEGMVAGRRTVLSSALDPSPSEESSDQTVMVPGNTCVWLAGP
ncbi:alpha-amylase family glycosyl hydrolase [Euzebya tangerina]|uniref:alpha-amylase family glycosyl hydrolase n=1 Tax=Euzebya tangerina TaxID=591198 RepID=UPI0013C2C7C8|nr:alpha-amylase family glycosyl hydrolase [Euzebya tangerina]